MTITPHERIGLVAFLATVILILLAWYLATHQAAPKPNVITTPAIPVSTPEAVTNTAPAGLNPIQGVYTNPF